MDLIKQIFSIICCFFLGKNKLSGRIVVKLDIQYPVNLDKALSSGKISGPTLTSSFTKEYNELVFSIKHYFR